MAKNKKVKKKNINPVEKDNSTSRQGLSPVSIAGFLLLLCFIVFGKTINHGFTMDDPLVIVENKIVQKGISALGEIWNSSYLQGYNGDIDAAYRPISLSQFAIEKTFFGGSAKMMHFMHILYYGIGISFCFLFSFLLFKKNKTLALFTTLLFLLHPIHTEVVNNLKSRDEIMLMLGVMGMGYFYLSYLDKKKMIHLVLSLVFYFVALFSKETAVSFFLLIPFIYLWITGKSNKNMWKHTALFLGMSLFYLLIRTLVVGSYDIEMTYMNNALVDGGNLIGRFPDTMMLMGKYFVMLIFPYPLSVDYSFNSIPLSGWASIWPYLSVLTIGGFSYLTYWGIKNRNIWGVLVPWFFITIVIASNVIVLIGSTFAERFLFVPSFAFCAAIPYLLNKYLAKKMKFIVLGLCIIYAGWTLIRNEHWKDDISLFSRDIKFQDQSVRINTFYGKFQFEEAKKSKGKDKIEKLEKANKALDKALEIAPDYMVAHHFKGFVAKEQEDSLTSSASFGKVVSLNPEFNVGRFQYALSLANEENHAKAIMQYDTLLMNNFQKFKVLINLGFSHLHNKTFKEAEKHFLQAYKINPKDTSVLNGLVKVYRDGLGNINEAKKYNDELKVVKGEK